VKHAHLLLWCQGEPDTLLSSSLPVKLAEGASLPKPGPPPSDLLNTAADPDSLPRQRWALLVPQGLHGQRLRVLLEPLRKRREEEQGAPADVFEVPPRLSAAEARDFRERVLQPSSRRLRDQARYLLLAGAPDVMPLELQDELGADGTNFVGRIAFEDEAGYEAYVAKLLASETRGRPQSPPRIVLASVNDGSDATAFGREALVEPLVARCQKEVELGELYATIQEEPLSSGSAQRLLELASSPRPQILFTLSHGLGAPLTGWSTAAEQRARQGALVLGDGAELTAPEVAQVPFIEAGIWFYFSCFGAGTPKTSLYQPWMERLHQEGHGFDMPLENTHRSRPLDGRPFLGALPCAALANPRGPLAVIAHMDLAWAFAFHDPLKGRAHPDRFAGVLAHLAQGHRVGSALHALTRFGLQVDAMIRRGDQEAAAEKTRAAVDPVPRAYLWMERHDLLSYMLLGDPATRLR